jgi:hypothetical protein
VEYAERLTVPLRWWVQATMLIATFWLALAVAVPPVAAFSVTGAICALVAAGFLRYGAARIEVDERELRAGRAHIATAYVGAVTPLDKEQARLVAGRDADVRAYLLLRPYAKRAVRVEINDPGDPTPYWLLSTRHPKRLARALSS